MNIVSLFSLKLLTHNVPKWSDTLSKSCSIFKVCLTILRHYALKGLILFQKDVSWSNVNRRQFRFEGFPSFKNILKPSIDSPVGKFLSNILGISNTGTGIETAWANFFGVIGVLVKSIRNLILKLGVASNKLLKRTVGLHMDSSVTKSTKFHLLCFYCAYSKIPFYTFLQEFHNFVRAL